MITAKERLQAINTLISHANTREALRTLVDYHLGKTIAQYDGCLPTETDRMVFIAGKRASLKELSAYADWTQEQLQAEIKKAKE